MHLIISFRACLDFDINYFYYKYSWVSGFIDPFFIPTGVEMLINIEIDKPYFLISGFREGKNEAASATFLRLGYITQMKLSHAKED